MSTRDKLDAPRSHRHPDQHLRSLLTEPWYPAIMTVIDAIATSSIDFFRDRGMRFVWTPLTTGTISSPTAPGSDSQPVKIRLCGRDTYLADSMQFLLEAALRLHPGGVYYISCSLRGDEPDTRHLAEFMHSEVEILGGLEDILSLAEAYVRHLARYILVTIPDTVLLLCGSTDHLRTVSEQSVFPRITFAEATGRLSQIPSALRATLPGEVALTAEGERQLLREIEGPLWLTHFPSKTSPFYQRRSTEEHYTLSADLLLGKGEVLGCGERCETRGQVEDALRGQNVDFAPYQWYLDLKDLSPLRTAGFGLGVERLVQWISKAEDIRDCTLWMRDHHHPIDP
ncbi:MAG: hypothetical protein HY820_07035 [Acidobacteria bacterium]|nr:hypothetical protein [Acidobacteriota bacterium]